MTDNPQVCNVKGIDLHLMSHKKLFCVLCQIVLPDPSYVVWIRTIPPTLFKDEHYFPFLQPMCKPPSYANICRFCSDLLKVQWSRYETMVGEKVPPEGRVYNVHYFTCCICGVVTFRRDVRALPFAEFPLLYGKTKKGGICITLPNNTTAAVVCLNCFNRFYLQKLEYDRLGVPEPFRTFKEIAKSSGCTPCSMCSTACTASASKVHQMGPQVERLANLKTFCNITQPNRLKTLESETSSQLCAKSSTIFETFSYPTHNPSTKHPQRTNWLKTLEPSFSGLNPTILPAASLLFSTLPQQNLCPTEPKTVCYTHEYFHYLYLQTKQTVCSEKMGLPIP